MGPEPNGWTGALLALVAIFLPSFLLIVGALPFWDILRSMPIFQSALKDINAAVVELLLTALYKPMWTSAIFSPTDFGLGLIAFSLLMFWKCPPWLVVVLTALGGEAIARV
jgi:chromate transporter